MNRRCRRHQDGLLLSEQGAAIIALSASGRQKLKVWTDRGYAVSGAQVSHTLAWRPQGSDTEHAVCLANIVLTKRQGT
ncbi:MAG: hypothetical protein IJ844_03085 [Prevotella sp.]|nr:hypothetical protein [Prevotella sp.]